MTIAAGSGRNPLASALGRALRLALALASLGAAGAALAAEGDVPGSADDPRLGRFAGSVITFHQAVEFDAHQVITGPIRARGQIESGERIEGRITRIAYRMPEGATRLQVVRNYEQRLAAQGFTIVFACEDRDCALTDFAHTVETVPIPHMNLDPFAFHYLAARRSGDGAEIWATVLVSAGGDGALRTQVIVAEPAAMAAKMIDAEAMAEGLGSEGHVALYHVLFDHDQATLRPESAPAIAEVARLLAAQPELSLLVVGHTDNVGGLEYNEALSRRRAEAVVATLVGEHGVAASRLTARGVGMVAPVASNRSEDGRARNRRVELVER